MYLILKRRHPCSRPNVHRSTESPLRNNQAQRLDACPNTCRLEEYRERLEEHRCRERTAASRKVLNKRCVIGFCFFIRVHFAFHRA